MHNNRSPYRRVTVVGVMIFIKNCKIILWSRLKITTYDRATNDGTITYDGKIMWNARCIINAWKW